MDKAAFGARSGAWETVQRLIATDGSAVHPHVIRLASTAAEPRDLSDAVHALCTVHGRHPGMADDALLRRALPEAGDWLERVADGFAAERGFIARLSAAAGPLPSTPDSARAGTALHGQRHAFEMLARSDRSGCATGAVAAMALDWLSIRTVLDRAADRFAVERPPLRLPTLDDTATILDAIGHERAITFGSQQLLAQHRGLWSLLEARSEARTGA